MASASNPSFQETLMELYGGRRQKDSVESGIVVHGNGSPFLPPVSLSLPTSSSLGGDPHGADISTEKQPEKTKGSTKARKKIGSSYHFIPTINGHRLRRGGNSSDSSSSDDDRGNSDTMDPYKNALVSSSENSLRDSGKTRSVGDGDYPSDQDMLRDIFSTNLSLNEAAPSKGIARSDSIFRPKGRGGEDNSGVSQLKMTNPLHSVAGRSIQVGGKDEAKDPFTSPLGKRIWQRYQNHKCRQQHHHSDESSGNTSLNQPTNQREHHQDQFHQPFVLSHQHLPSPDFLRLPPSRLLILGSAPNKMEWVNTEELERKVLQHHLDSETSEPEPVQSPLMREENDALSGNISNSLSSSLLTSECFTRVIERDPQVGLGMSLREFDGCVYIQALLRRDGLRLEEDRIRKGGKNSGPAINAGLLLGDRLLGLNGHPFLKGRLATDNVATPATENGVQQSLRSHVSSEEMLKSVADMISTAKSPMALHIQRESDREPILAILRKLQTEFKDKIVPATNNASRQAAKVNATMNPKGPNIHPFARALSERSLIKRGKEESIVTRQLKIFTDRTRQWESKLSFRLRASDFTLRPLLDARDVEPSYYASFITDDGECPPFFDYKFSKSLRSYAPSTPMIEDWRLSRMGGDMLPPVRRFSSQVSREAAIMADLYAGLDKEDADVQNLFLGSGSGASNGEGVAYPSSVMQAMSDPTDIFVPLMGIRKAICVRIVNTFLDNRNRTAFTIWCYDVESGMEWYAPVRYYNDFKDLRSALMQVDKSIGDIPFPSLGWSLGFSNEAKESAKTKEARRCQLEIFLKRVFAGLYRGRLHPYLAETAVHLQTFVGCDTILRDGDDSSLSLSKQVAISESSYGKRTPDPKSEPNNNAQMRLKRSIMRYCYRLFLLPSVEQLVSQFVNAAMDKVTTETSVSSLKAQQLAVEKDKATQDVTKIRDFIDQVQELILEGCREDFVSIAQRRDFAALVDDLDNSTRDNLFREAVREQTELEIYVPLRSTISKYLVYAWFNEDMEMKHKMKALAEKPQSYFRIPKEHRSRSDWKSVSRILQEGVGRSTLPCVKLRAVVDAAKEISQLDSEERSVFPDTTFFDAKVTTRVKTLGADDFLPIFIFCFVQAKIERPSALCELLSLMCDPEKMSGETGYYLASFHAALTHIHELDLSESENDLSIIFDT